MNRDSVKLLLPASPHVFIGTLVDSWQEAGCGLLLGQSLDFDPLGSDDRQ